ncbi:hypothetical protein ACFX1T_020260 [Malus domestica]
MQGIAVGRAVDLTRFERYEDLLKKLEEMFDIEGELCRSTKKWQVVYTDDEDDMMMVGDDPWLAMIHAKFPCMLIWSGAAVYNAHAIRRIVDCSREKKRKKKTHHQLYYPPPPPRRPPPPPPGHYCCSYSSSSTQPSAPPLPPWLDADYIYETPLAPPVQPAPEFAYHHHDPVPSQQETAFNTKVSSSSTQYLHRIPTTSYQQ